MIAQQSGQTESNFAQLQALQGHEMEVRLRANDLQSRLEQLQSQRGPGQPASLAKELETVQHQLAAASLDAEATRERLRLLIAREDMRTATLQNPARDRMFGRKELQSVGLGLFFLAIPLVLAMARRIWVRSGPRQVPIVDLEASPRLERLEQAIESIAVEVERIGEGQRFATKLLSERPEAAVHRAPPANRREPGTITPH